MSTYSNPPPPAGAKPAPPPNPPPAPGRKYRVSVESDGTPGGTVITDEHGDLIHGISRVVFAASANHIPQLDVLMHSPSFSCRAGAAAFWMIHPVSGKMCKVDTVRFADGSQWVAP